MRKLGGFAILAAVALALAGQPSALGSHADGEGDPRDWTAGGGQVVLDPENLEAAGDTIAFNAQTRPPSGDAQGQIQYVATSLAGEEMDRWHGIVECLVVDGDTATIGGSIAANEGSTVAGRFAVRVTDNGTPEGGGGDTILLSYGEETKGDCSDDDYEDLPELTLARGNVTVHDAS